MDNQYYRLARQEIDNAQVSIGKAIDYLILAGVGYTSPAMDFPKRLLRNIRRLNDYIQSVFVNDLD